MDVIKWKLFVINFCLYLSVSVRSRSRHQYQWIDPNHTKSDCHIVGIETTAEKRRIPVYQKQSEFISRKFLLNYQVTIWVYSFKFMNNFSWNSVSCQLECLIAIFCWTSIPRNDNCRKLITRNHLFPEEKNSTKITIPRKHNTLNIRLTCLCLSDRKNMYSGAKPIYPTSCVIPRTIQY